MDTHIHNTYQLFFNIVLNYMIYERHNYFILNVNNNILPDFGNSNDTPENRVHHNDNNNNNLHTANDHYNIIGDNNENNIQENATLDPENDINTNANNPENSNNEYIGNNVGLNNNNEISTTLNNNNNYPQNNNESNFIYLYN